MDPSYWHQKWEAQDTKFDQSEPNSFLTSYFKHFSLPKGARVLVPLCGKSVDMLWLAEQGCHVIGVELSAIACQAFFDQSQRSATVSEHDRFTIFQGHQVTLFSGDFFDVTTDEIGKIDFVYDRAALVALPAELRQQYSAHLTTLMPSEAQMLLIVAAYDQHQMAGPPFSVDQACVEKLYQDYFDIDCLYAKCIENLPTHLKAKGLTWAKEEVYKLTKR